MLYSSSLIFFNYTQVSSVYTTIVKSNFVILYSLLFFINIGTGDILYISSGNFFFSLVTEPRITNRWRHYVKTRREDIQLLVTITEEWLRWYCNGKQGYTVLSYLVFTYLGRFYLFFFFSSI
ncbi:hypothetical protein BDA99DRAFT_505454, partial [Phascolomyces articulosus]